MKIFLYQEVHFVLMLSQVVIHYVYVLMDQVLNSAITHEPTTFTIETKGAGQGSLGLAIEGPSEAKMVCKDNQDGTCIMEYLPVRKKTTKFFFKFQY